MKRFDFQAAQREAHELLTAHVEATRAAGKPMGWTELLRIARVFMDTAPPSVIQWIVAKSLSTHVEGLRRRAAHEADLADKARRKARREAVLAARAAEMAAAEEKKKAAEVVAEPVKQEKARKWYQFWK